MLVNEDITRAIYYSDLLCLKRDLVQNVDHYGSSLFCVL